MAFQRGPHVREIFVAKDDIFKKDKKPKSKNNKNVNEPGKLGQYKPRILSADPIVNVPIPKVEPTEKTFTTSQPYIIGDKDTPIILHPVGPEEEIIPDYPETIRQPRTRETSNPVFNQKEAAKLERNTEIINGVVIPPPDYNEEGIYAEIKEKIDINRPLHRNYGGEDYSKFLDDEEESNHGGLTWRSEKPQNRKSIPAYDKKAKTEIKRPHRYQKRESKIKNMFGTNKTKVNTARNSQIREFSFADTKSISKQDNHMVLKKQLSTGSEGDDTDKFLNPLGKEQSYESFLEARHDTNFSNDSAIEPGQDYFGSPPSSQKENNFWKRLTWRFRQKNNNSYYMAYE